VKLRQVVAWVLYDFANSSFAAIVMGTVYAAYYANGVVGNAEGEGDLWWGRVVSFSMAVVALTSPFLGAVADRSGIRRRLFIGFTALAVGATALMATVHPGMVGLGFLLGVLGNVGFESALVYYNAWLPQLAPAGRQGRLSAWGFAVGYAGSLIALVAAYPLVRDEAYGQAFLVTAALFGGFALPAFFFLPPPPAGTMAPLAALRLAAAELREGIRAIVANRDLRWFFAAYFLYEDGVNTVITFSGIFAVRTLGFPMDQLIVLYVVVQLSALLGALAWSWPTDWLGPRRVVIFTLCQWSAVVIAAYFVQTQAQFYAVAIVAGTGLGAVQAASRTLLTTLIPRGMEARMFGFYALCGKSAAILGPQVFGGISHAAGGNQRLGILAIGAFFVVGLALLGRMRGGGPTHLAAVP
jgi:UMF1 family MFS transporter